MTFLTLLGKDARLLARHRVLLVALIVYPLVLAGLLHAVFAAPPQKLSVALLNEDEDGFALQVGNETLSSETFVNMTSRAMNVHNVTSREDGRALLREGTVDAIIVIPPGFVRDLSRQGSGANLTVVTDAADPVRASIASSAIQGYAQAFSRLVVEKKVEEVLRNLRLAIDGGTVRVVVFDVRVQGLNETIRELTEVREEIPEGSEEHRKVDEAVTYLEFARDALGGAREVLIGAALPLTINEESYARSEPKLSQAALPGALALSVFWTGALSAAALFASEGEAGVLTRMQATATRGWARAASKIVIALVVVFVQGALVIAVAAFAWNEQPASPWLAVPALALAGAAAAAGGALAAGVARGRAGSALVIVLVLLPMTLLAGLFFPVAFMPDWVQVLARVMPLTHAVDAFRDVLVRGAPLVATAPALGALAVTTGVAGAAGAGLLRGRV